MARNLLWVVLTLVLAAGACAIVNLGFSGPSAPQTGTATGIAALPALSDSASPIATKFNGHLLALGPDGEPHAFDGTKLAPVKYFAFYYSASWCPPCRSFTPDLVSFYNDFKPSHPNFELIFVNDDRSDGDMINYMKNDSMPWPAVWYAEIDNPALEAKKYCGSGIPCLVLVDGDGQVLSDTFQNGSYTDPHHVIDDIRQLVR